MRTAGYAMGVRHLGGAPARTGLDAVLRLEARRFGPSLASLAPPPAPMPLDAPDLILDLTPAGAPPMAAPRLRLTWSGQPDPAAGLATLLAPNALPELTLWRDDMPVGQARPMRSDRLWLSRTADEMLAGAVALLEQGIARHCAGRLEPLSPPPPVAAPRGFFRHYFPHAAKEATARLAGKLTHNRPFYWQVGYRRASSTIDPDAPGLGPRPFMVLEDDGTRFYADPFAIEHAGQTWLFVEDYPYALGRGLISVSRLEADGHFSTPRVVLDEPYHLSYPQVFAQDGAIFMLPESGGAGVLRLYRAENFPHHWVPDTDLLSGVDINDATLVPHRGRFYLFATQRLGPGSASDILVVYTAPALRGPWAPHRLNPIAIDRAGARPGGAVLRRDGRLWLKVQDGTRAYGAGLGLREILHLDEDDVRLGPTRPLSPHIHTFNAAGGMELVDTSGHIAALSA